MLKAAFYILTISFFFNTVSLSQTESTFPKTYSEEEYTPLLDSLRQAYGEKISYKNSEQIELATLLAISHYPFLQNRKVKVIIRKVKGAPVEASFSPLNVVTPARSKVYKIIIKENSFMERLSLNKQVAALGHEMAHFIQYEERGYFGTLFGLLRYVSSDKYRIKFEKTADKIAMDHGLGPQMLEFAFYTSKEDIQNYMNQMGYGN
ncbi:hypothetical protein [Roseivirga echinicomitans]|uniref:Uncharacterized protein n=1 Tax=Roseivirga echinicomitans TaxID=296218 RepID=A0A150XA11_9BACT|nr:hypothetical protein [Roseivirga echinicomitans]KYG75558.1 hypothetical protein AWN68_07315 [Roseivirga echinicomitans]